MSTLKTLMITAIKNEKEIVANSNATKKLNF